MVGGGGAAHVEAGVRCRMLRKRLPVSEEEKNEWTQDQKERLCALYREEPLLYTIKHPAYHKRNLRDSAWQRVAKEMATIRPGVSGL